MIKEYRDTLGEPITEEQLEEQLGGCYSLLYYEPDTHFLKKIVKYSRNKIFEIRYFIEDAENKADIIRDLSAESILFKIITREVINGFMILTMNRFNTRKGLNWLAKEVYEITDTEYQYMICGQFWNEETHKPILDSTYKSYFSFNEQGRKVQGVVFTYLSDGNLKLATDMTPYYDNHKFWEEYTLDNFQGLQSLFTIDISYYKTADFLPPEGMFNE